MPKWDKIISAFPNGNKGWRPPRKRAMRPVRRGDFPRERCGCGHGGSSFFGRYSGGQGD
jgi:hypothetical protein